MPCPTTSRSISSAPAQLHATAAPSRPPAGSRADRAPAQHTLDLWVDLLADVIVAEVCRDRQVTATSAEGSATSTRVAEAWDNVRPAAPSDEGRVS